ncbi:MAG: hypothetical protein ACK5S9_09950, partial [Roseiflexaceae bacterium]
MKILTILGAVVGVLSLFANIALGYSAYTLNTEKAILRQRLIAQIVDYNAIVSTQNATKKQLNETTVELTAARESISTLNTQLNKAKADINT